MDPDPFFFFLISMFGWNHMALFTFRLLFPEMDSSLPRPLPFP